MLHHINGLLPGDAGKCSHVTECRLGGYKWDSVGSSKRWDFRSRSDMAESGSQCGPYWNCGLFVETHTREVCLKGEKGNFLWHLCMGAPWLTPFPVTHCLLRAVSLKIIGWLLSSLSKDRVTEGRQWDLSLENWGGWGMDGRVQGTRRGQRGRREEEETKTHFIWKFHIMKYMYASKSIKINKQFISVIYNWF